MSYSCSSVHVQIVHVVILMSWCRSTSTRSIISQFIQACLIQVYINNSMIVQHQQ